MIKIYTDGGCKGNPGPGAWAFIITIKNQKKIKKSGSESYTTNNKMELSAVINALKEVKKHENLLTDSIVLNTDSKYVKNGITIWIKNWIKNGWKTASKQAVKNKEYWIELGALNDELKINWKWVKGHAGNRLNEECDAMVGREIAKIT